MMKKKSIKALSIFNRKATFSYQLLDKSTAGIILQGSEVKSIRNGSVDLKEAYCYFANNELFVKNMHISLYKPAAHNNHEPTRTRKLLLQRQELRKLQKKKKEQGSTIVPLRLFISKGGYVKLEIALAKGKKLHDKRQSMKEREVKKRLQRLRYKSTGIK